MILTRCYIRKPSLICDWQVCPGDSWPDGCLTKMRTEVVWNLSHCHWALDHNFFLAYTTSVAQRSHPCYLFSPQTGKASVPHHNFILYARSCEINRHLNYEQQIIRQWIFLLFIVSYLLLKCIPGLLSQRLPEGWEEELFSTSASPVGCGLINGRSVLTFFCSPESFTHWPWALQMFAV